MTLAENANNRGLLKIAHYALGASLQQAGELSRARDQLERALAVKDNPPLEFGPDPNVLCLTTLSDTLFILGFPDQSLRRSYEAMEVVKRESDPFSYAMAQLFVVQAHCARREAEKGEELSRKVIKLCTEHGFPFWLAAANRCLGWATVMQGRLQEGIAMMNQQLVQGVGYDAELDQFNILPMLADTYGNLGQFDRGFAALEQWLGLRSKNSVAGMDKIYYRVRGDLLLKAGSADEAEESLRKAIDLSASQSAKMEQLRSTRSLARLLAKKGKRDEARTMLAEIYGWFTEGFDTADLNDAKALLAELSA